MFDHGFIEYGTKEYLFCSDNQTTNSTFLHLAFAIHFKFILLKVPCGTSVTFYAFNLNTLKTCYTITVAGIQLKFHAFSLSLNFGSHPEAVFDSFCFIGMFFAG